MADGTPIPILVSGKEISIPSVNDLEEAADKKLPERARGNRLFFNLASVFPVH